MDRNPEIYKATKKDLAFRPQPVGPKAAQWWYHDGIFDNGYCVQVHFWLNDSLARINLEISDPDGKSFGTTRRFARETVNASTEQCDVDMGGANRMYGEYPTYNISIHNGDLGLDLVYECMVQEFREPPDGCYIGRMTAPATPKYLGYVLRPRCKVVGNLIIGGKKIPVNGQGYCDHQWSNVLIPDLMYHWYWGKAYLPSHTVFWWDAQLHESLGYQRAKWLWVFRGDKLFRYLRDAYMYVEASNIDRVDQSSGIAYPGKVVLTIDDIRIKGTLAYKIRQIVNTVRPPMPEGRIYLRYLSDCHAKLDIGDEKIEYDSIELHESYI